MNTKHTTSFFTQRYFVACAVLATIGLALLIKFSPAKAKPEEVTITSTDWVCVDSRPALLHAECMQYVRRVGK